VFRIELPSKSPLHWIGGPPSLPIILSIVAVVGLSIAGYLGGELVFHHGVAVTANSTAPEKPEAQCHVRAASEKDSTNEESGNRLCAHEDHIWRDLLTRRVQ
jgi:hypothetical protein